MTTARFPAERIYYISILQPLQSIFIRAFLTEFFSPISAVTIQSLRIQCRILPASCH